MLCSSMKNFFNGVVLFLFLLFVAVRKTLFNNNSPCDRYSVNAQVVCDMDGAIIAVHAGCPGAASDPTAFQRMDQFRVPKDFFSPGEYLLADSAYTVSRYCVPPYKSPAADLPENSEFNTYLACSRVRNEHCIGVLKGRWQSLRELRHHLRDDKNMENLCAWVVGCCVLHNIMVHLRDAWIEEEEEEESCYQPSIVFDSQHTVTGLTFRETLKKTTIETNRARKQHL
jgi:hypothetical protein